MPGSPDKDKPYDLEERTARFGQNIINFAQHVPKNVVTVPLVQQLVRAGTSVGANYCEADDAESRKDFQHKLCIVKKEAHEAQHWLRMIVHAFPECRDAAAPLWREAKELNLICNAIVHRSRANTRARS